jgi:hypothetical protein
MLLWTKPPSLFGNISIPAQLQNLMPPTDIDLISKRIAMRLRVLRALGDIMKMPKSQSRALDQYQIALPEARATLDLAKLR